MQNMNFNRNQYQHTNMRKMATDDAIKKSNIFSATSSKRVMAPVDNSYTESFIAEKNKINLESETESDPEDIFERKLWF
jgi:hypothetical protein